MWYQMPIAPTNPGRSTSGRYDRGLDGVLSDSTQLGPKGADWSDFTAGPTQPTEENSGVSVAKGPEAHFKDQSMQSCWQLRDQGGNVTIHKPVLDT